MNENNSPRLIAGHQMVDTFHGLTCQDCGRRFVDLACVTLADIGSEGWAAYGALNRQEYDSIRAEVDRVWAHTLAVASGAGIGGMAPMDETP